MINFDLIKIYLPKYLSKDSFKTLIQELKNFPDNIDDRFYTTNLEENIIYQGDGIDGLLLMNLPDKKIDKGKVIVLSNTCDIDENNKRIFPARITYAPIFDLDKYTDSLKRIPDYNEEKIEQHLRAIKKQEITQIFYLPQAVFENNEEGIVFLDRINNCSSSYLDRDELSKNRLFSLSNYGWYLFLFKLSIHFTRMQEKVDRIL